MTPDPGEKLIYVVEGEPLSPLEDRGMPLDHAGLATQAVLHLVGEGLGPDEAVGPAGEGEVGPQ